MRRILGFHIHQWKQVGLRPFKEQHTTDRGTKYVGEIFEECSDCRKRRIRFEKVSPKDIMPKTWENGGDLPEDVIKTF